MAERADGDAGVKRRGVELGGLGEPRIGWKGRLRACGATLSPERVPAKVRNPPIVAVHLTELRIALE